MLKFKKLLELQGRSQDTLELSVPFFIALEAPFFLHGFKKFLLQAKPYGQYNEVETVLLSLMNILDG